MLLASVSLFPLMAKADTQAPTVDDLKAQLIVLIKAEIQLLEEQLVQLQAQQSVQVPIVTQPTDQGSSQTQTSTDQNSTPTDTQTQPVVNNPSPAPAPENPAPVGSTFTVSPTLTLNSVNNPSETSSSLFPIYSFTVNNTTATAISLSNFNFTVSMNSGIDPSTITKTLAFVPTPNNLPQFEVVRIGASYGEIPVTFSKPLVMQPGASETFTLSYIFSKPLNSGDTITTNLDSDGLGDSLGTTTVTVQ